MSEAGTSVAEPRCPRCEYDLRGLIAAWYASPETSGAACPTQCTCAECGLRFGSADVLVASRARCPGLFEHARSGRAVAGLVTLGWLALPWVFWSRVRMQHRVHARRIVLPAAVLIAAALCADRIILFTAHLWAQSGGARVVGEGPLDVPAWMTDSGAKAMLFPFVEERVMGMQAGVGAAVAAMILTAHAMWPLLLLALPQTRLRAKVSRQHLLRAWAYSLWPIAGVAGLCTLALATDLFAQLDAVPDWTRGLRTAAQGMFVAAGLGGVVYVLHVSLWWSLALTKGWRVHGGWWLALLLALTVGLAVFTALGFVMLLGNQI